MSLGRRWNAFTLTGMKRLFHHWRNSWKHTSTHAQIQTRLLKWGNELSWFPLKHLMRTRVATICSPLTCATTGHVRVRTRHRVIMSQAASQPLRMSQDWTVTVRWVMALLERKPILQPHSSKARLMKLAGCQVTGMWLRGAATFSQSLFGSNQEGDDERFRPLTATSNDAISDLTPTQAESWAWGATLKLLGVQIYLFYISVTICVFYNVKKSL